MNLKDNLHLEELINDIKKIDTSELNDIVDKTPLTKVVESQKVYFWSRLYLKQEDPNIEIGDEIVIKWKPSGEELKTKFIAYGKVGLSKEQDKNVINYITEDDKKVLSLMIDSKDIDYNDDIPFIRTLFKTSRYFDYQLVRHDELLFINLKNNMIIDYYDCDF